MVIRTDYQDDESGNPLKKSGNTQLYSQFYLFMVHALHKY